MLSCKEVTRKIASDELVVAEWRERLPVRLHLLWCRHCRRYMAQMRAIGRAARNLWGPRSQDPEALKRLERGRDRVAMSIRNEPMCKYFQSREPEGGAIDRPPPAKGCR